MTREEVLQKLRNGKRDLLRRYPVTRLALFGSYARGDSREDSDVDILVDVDPSIGLRFVSLADDLERILGKKVELVSTRAISPKMMPMIENDCIDVE